MDIRKSFRGKYMNSGDFDDPRVLTMTKVYKEKIGPNKVEKHVLYFQGYDRGLVLNSTNARTIAGIHGWETGDWKGKEIEVYPTTTEFDGETVNCLRVRKPEIDETKGVDGSLSESP